MTNQLIKELGCAIAAALLAITTVQLPFLVKKDNAPLALSAIAVAYCGLLLVSPRNKQS